MTQMVTSPSYITSHVGTPKKVLGKKHNRDRISEKNPTKQPKLKIIIHAFGLSRGMGSRRNVMPPRDMEGH